MVWEIEQDQSDLQYDLIRDGRVIQFGIPTLDAVADLMVSMKAEPDGVVMLPGGAEVSAADFIDQHR